MLIANAQASKQAIHLGVDDLMGVWAILCNKAQIRHRDRVACIKRIQYTLRWSGIMVALSWVPSKWNPADLISKIFEYPPPLRKHQPDQESDSQTGSWCLDKAVQLRNARYQRKHAPKTCPYLTLSTIVATGRFWWGCGVWGQLWALPSCDSLVVESSPRVERPRIVAGASAPVDRTYVTAKPGVTTLVMAENHTKPKSSGVQYQAECCNEQEDSSQA